MPAPPTPPPGALAECAHYGPVTAVKFYGSSLLVGYGPVLRSYHVDAASGALALAWQQRVFRRNKIHCISVADDQQTAAVSGGRSFAVVDLSTRQSTEKAINEWIVSVECVSAAQTLLLTSHNEVLQVAVDAAHGCRVAHKLHCGEKSLLYSGSIARCAGGRTYVAAGTVMSGVLVWDLATRRVVHTLAHHEGSIFAVRIDRGGRFAVSCSDDRSIKLYDLASGAVLATGWGHGSRIWSLSFGSVSPTEVVVVSTGEDGSARVWTHAVGSARLDQTACFDGCHEGKHVWSGDAHWPAHLVATGGADGKVRLLDVAPARRAHAQLTAAAAAAATGVPLAPKEALRQFVEFPHAHCAAALSSHGQMFVHGRARGWAAVPLRRDAAGAFRDPALLRACRAANANAAVLCSRTGDVLAVGLSHDAAVAYQEYLPAARAGKIINVLAADTADGVLLLMDGADRGAPMRVQRLVAAHGTLRAGAAHDLPRPDPRNFHPTAVHFHAASSWLVVGSRHANFAVYSLAAGAAPAPYLVRKLCPGDTITSVSAAHATRDSLTVLVTVRDGVYMLVRVWVQNGAFAHEVVVQNKFPRGSVEGGFCRGPDVYLYGFRSGAFYLWNETRQMEVYHEPCGGGHRQWAFTPHAADPDRFHFSYVGKDGVVQNAVHCRFGLAHNGRLAAGTHGREIRSVDVCAAAEPDGTRLVATASEDATVKLGSLSAAGAVDYFWTLNNHVSGLQSVQFLGSEYVASAAANEELLVWKLDRGIPARVSMVEHARLPPTGANPDLRVMDFSAVAADGGGFWFACVFSNSVIKLYHYSTAARSFRLLATESYGTCCLLNCKLLRSGDRVLLVVGATDGCVSVWDLAAQMAGPAPFAFGPPAAKQQLHQSGVKALAVVPQAASSASWKIVTGGDDNALVMCELTLDGSVDLAVLATVEAAASATITGIAPAGDDKVLVTSVDQIVRLWDLAALTCDAATYTTVADTGCCSAAFFGDKVLGVVGGAGLSIFEW